MFLTMESARLPCWTTFSRLSFSRPVNSSTSPRTLLSKVTGLSTSFSSSVNSAGQRREIVDEIERVLDLVGDACRQLTERGELLCLHQAVLRGAQIVE